MRKIILLILLIAFLATPAHASYYHEIIIEVEGEWEINSSFAAPEIASEFTLKGTGKAIVKAITAAKAVPGDWWKLF